ncbi:nitrogenase component I subunit alpha [Leadbettera azotonutricia]|uniref:Nitrogenase protein alpha chain n=1 Tax=Leadbettera azotonutricia (strain ATCC BAA-888 / DSM 13862 / ZAS-9) TaxID=545695 RepID=F5Y9Q3_LEAAZ|nr:nitrogenase component I subunit alpha [Leadbettera azotonutricia]AEF81090.1 nitrogenase molybdenum-iron protein alpha chain [Leadbettera azotonutricia ZAS-9]
MAEVYELPDTAEFKAEILERYPPKLAKKRAKQIIINKIENDDDVPEILANTRTIPGIITMRGCAYAGCKGVVLGPTRDILQITHGPIGCGFYSWLTRRNQTKPTTESDVNYMTYAMSTDLQEEEIIFGGEKKLRAAIDEAVALFHPRAIGIFATCPVGLIGDDVHAVARAMEEKYPDINIFGFSCEGYKGVSQSAGHHVANNKVFTDVVGLNDTFSKPGKFKFNILGEYNIGGDAFEIERIVADCGLSLHSTFSGNSTYDEFSSAHTVDLNVVMCHRSINYLAEMMEKKYGIPWFKVNFVGAEATSKSLRKIAQFYEDADLLKKTEEVIERELVEVEKVRLDVKSRCEGKTAVLYVGGSRAHHYQELLREIGITILSAGYEFAHRDDYEGRKVMPSIIVDADSRNIEELKVEADAVRYKPRLSEEKKASMEADGFAFSDYNGLMTEMPESSLVIDDCNHYELEELLDRYHPDLVCAGIKEKYVVQKRGIPMKQLHSYDYMGPFAGYKGAINFYKEIDRLLNCSAFKFTKAPWDESPELSATYAFN